MHRSAKSMLGAASITMLWMAACSSGTAGKQIEVGIAFEGLADDGEAVGHFVTSTGWTVDLAEARIAIGPLYAYPSEAIALGDVLALPTAFAHGGFDPLSGRRVSAELLEQVDLDVLAPDVVQAGVVTGEEGVIDELTLVLDPLDGGDAPLSGHVAWVAGVATKDDQRIEFEGALDLGEGLERRIEMVRGDREMMLGQGATIVVGIKPARWLDGAQFDRLEQTDGVATITSGSQARSAWYLGARSPSSFHVRVIEGAPQ